MGAEYKTDYGLSALNEIFNRRLGKWTFITSNFSLQYIYNDFDGRIASRMMRGNNEIIQTNAIDYNLRKIDLMIPARKCSSGVGSRLQPIKKSW